MRKMILMVAGLLLSTAVVSTYGVISQPWGDYSGVISDQNGVDQGTTGAANWEWQLIADPSGNTVVSAMITANQLQIGMANTWTVANGASDDIIVGSSSGHWDVGLTGVEGPSAGSTSGIDDAYALKSFYFRFFNNASADSATYGGLVYNSAGWVLPGVSPATPTADGILNRGTANIAGTTHASVAGGWATVIPVPEPGTMGLMAIGMAIVALKRKIAK